MVQHGYSIQKKSLIFLVSNYVFVLIGWELYRRLHYIERMWPYFFGFGLPLALVTHYLPNYFITTAFFPFLFPLFILSANEAQLEPSTRYTKQSICSIVNNLLLCSDHKIPFFSFVVWLSNKLLVTLFDSNFIKLK